MMALARVRPAALLLLLTVTLTLGAGCKKQRANLNQKKLADMVNTAQGHEADKYRKTEFDALKQQVQQAQAAYQGQQYDVAFETSRQALAQAETFLEEVKRERAADLQNRVAADIKIATDNGGESLDQKRFQTILEFQEQGREEFSKNDWDGAIEAFVRASQEVDSLLAPLKQDATSRLAQIRNRVTEMETEQVREYAIDQGIQVDELLKQAEQLIDPQRQYRTAQTILSTTNQKIDEAIETAKEVRGQLLLSQIELDLMLAIQKGARVFFPERLKSAAALYETMLRDFENRSFDNVLQAGGLLTPQVKQLRYDTRQKSAESKVQSLQTDIENLTAGGAREYLPGTVESLEALLEDARTQLNTKQEDGFEEAEQITQAAAEEHARILADFNELANQAISEANKELEIATGVFRATDTIFDVSIPGRATTDLERQLEKNKQALKAELQILVDSARMELGTAQLRRDSQEYREAIEAAEAVEETALLIQDETYKVAAHNSILEVQSALSYYSSQGGSQYAPKQVQEVQQILEESRQLIEAGKPKESVDRSALAKAQLDVLRQTLSEQGAQNLLKAEEAIRQAVETRALEYASGRMNEARSRLENAIKARDMFDYQEVIESAASAQSLADAAKTYAQRQFAEAQIAEASSRLQRATAADAPLYAPRVYKEASDKIAAARNMVSGNKLEEAAALAGEAAELANQATYERVIAAEQEIENARHFKSWEYSSATTADAINAAKESRRQADLGNFDLARAYADESIRLSKAAALTSKGADVALRLAGLSEDVKEGMATGANYYQGDEVKEIIQRMGELQATYTPDNYEAADAELRELEARLSEILINTPAVLERVVQEQTVRRQLILDSPIEIEIFAGDQLEEAEKLLRYAKIDFDKCLYSKSYYNLRRAISLIDEADMLLAASDYNAKLTVLFAEFVEAQDKFSQVLSLSEVALIQFAVNTVTDQPQVTALAGEYSPNEYRDRIENIYKRAKAINPPPFKKLTHESVIDLFELALRSAQNFEKLVILNQFSQKDARDIIHDAYEQLRRARELQHQVQQTFLEPGVDSIIVRKRQVAGTQLY